MKKIAFAVLVVMVAMMSVVGIATAHDFEFDKNGRPTTLSCYFEGGKGAVIDFETKLQYVDASFTPSAVRSEVKSDINGYTGIQNLVVMNDYNVLFLTHSSPEKGTTTAYCDIELKVCWVSQFSTKTFDTNTRPFAFSDLNHQPFYRVIETFCLAVGNAAGMVDFCKNKSQNQNHRPKNPAKSKCEACDGD